MIERLKSVGVSFFAETSTSLSKDVPFFEMEDRVVRASAVLECAHFGLYLKEFGDELLEDRCAGNYQLANFGCRY